ncbi:MAG TPA: hypothetical protein VNG33_22250 [Polyangiaceae bacterium]|nr:hypothetical protein [Polyangiaceae bacterium]
MRGLWTILLLGLGLALGCGNGSSFSGADSAGQVRQGSELVLIPARGVPHVVLIAVDDAATTDARAFRSTLATDFRENYLASRAVANQSCAPPRDPAALPPVQEYAIVLAPSATGDQAARSFATDPSLAWLADERLDADAAAWSNAVAQAIEATETPEPGSYEPVALLEHWTKLLGHEALPVGELEQAIVDALPQHVDVEPFLASPRADDIPQPATDDRLTPKTNCDPGAPCVQSLQSSKPDSKLFASHLIADCRPRCMDSPARDEASGAVECRLLVVSYRSDDCASTPGWSETTLAVPELKELVGDSPGYRTCEITQLEGAALDACVNDFDCKDCTPGFCATRVPLLLEDCSRDVPSTPWPFRFPGLPGRSERMWVEAQCNFGR